MSSAGSLRTCTGVLDFVQIGAKSGKLRVGKLCGVAVGILPGDLDIHHRIAFSGNGVFDHLCSLYVRGAHCACVVVVAVGNKLVALHIGFCLCHIPAQGVGFQLLNELLHLLAVHVEQRLKRPHGKGENIEKDIFKAGHAETVLETLFAVKPVGGHDRRLPYPFSGHAVLYLLYRPCHSRNRLEGSCEKFVNLGFAHGTHCGELGQFLCVLRRV